MIRLTRNFALAVALMLVAPLSAQALSVSIVGATGSGASDTVLQPGETITFELVAENNTAVQLFGLALGVRGYDADANGEVDDGLSYANSGQVAGSVFNIARVSGPPAGAVGGLNNQLTAPEELGFFNPITFESEEKRVQLFNGVEVVPSAGSGADDIGIGGYYVGDGDVHFLVTFQATPVQRAAMDFTLDFGTFDEFGESALGDGGALLPFGNTQYILTVIPEPGTALLMGLGLAGLAAQRRR